MVSDVPASTKEVDDDDSDEDPEEDLEDGGVSMANDPQNDRK